MGFGRLAEVLEPAHLWQAVAEVLEATAERYAEEAVPMYRDDSERTLS